MGLLDFLGGNQAQMPGQPQQPGFFGKLFDPAIALPMAQQLMGNQGNMANFGNAFGAAGTAMAGQKELQAQTAQKNATVEFFRKQAPEYAQMIDAGMPVGDAFKLYTQQRYAQKSDSVYGTPIYGTDPETGQTGVGVIGKDGNFKKLDTGGFQVAPGTTWQDFGTYRQPFNSKTAAPVGAPVPIDNAGAAQATAAGKEAGTAQGTYESMQAKMAGLEQVVSQLDTLAEQATYTLAGQGLDAGRRQLGMEPRESAVAREQYIAMVNNQILPMLRDTFGAQFTVQEGESLKATLGAPNKSPAEKQAVLKAFIEQKRRDVEALGVQSGQLPPQPAGQGQRLRFNPATGELE